MSLASLDELAANFLRFNPCLLSGVVLLTFWHCFIETATTSSKDLNARSLLDSLGRIEIVDFQ